MRFGDPPDFDGKYKLSSKQIALQLGINNSEKVRKFIKYFFEINCIRNNNRIRKNSAGNSCFQVNYYTFSYQRSLKNIKPDLLKLLGRETQNLVAWAKRRSSPFGSLMFFKTKRFELNNFNGVDKMENYDNMERIKFLKSKDRI